MIEAVGLARSFGGRPAVRDASFRVEAGQIVGFLGPNGAGKTTTIRMLLGLVQPDAGTARVEGPVGYLPEVFAAYDALSVASYLRFMARMKAVDAADVERVMGTVDLTDLASRPVSRLSKGQRQRVGLAQSLLGRPPSYVFDEPTQGLDPAQVVEVRVMVRALAREEGAAVLLSTHLLSEAATLCDRVVVIAAGRVVADEVTGETADLEARFLRLIGEAELS